VQIARKGIIQFKLSSVTHAMSRSRADALALGATRRILAADSEHFHCCDSTFICHSFMFADLPYLSRMMMNSVLLVCNNLVNIVIYLEFRYQVSQRGRAVQNSPVGSGRNVGP